MNKVFYVIKEFGVLISSHKLYFLAPLLIMLGLLVVLFVKLGPAIVMTFIYAGA